MFHAVFRRRFVTPRWWLLLVVISLSVTLTSQNAFARSSAAASTSSQVIVPSTVQWQDTGITLNVGDAVNISATGSWSTDPGDGFTTPDGNSQPGADNFLNLSDIGTCSSCASTLAPHWGALIGYIGNNPPAAGSYTSTSVLADAQKVFFVGSTYQSSASFAGRLWLNFNDDAYSANTVDNAGQVTAKVTATSSTPTPKPLGGTWISPGNNFVAAGMTLHFAAHAYGGAGVDHVNFTATSASNSWFVACTAFVPTPGTKDIYECNWNLTNGKAILNGAIKVSFDVYDKAGKRILSPNGTHIGSITSKSTTIKPGGLWIRTITNATSFDIGPFTLIARAYPTHTSDPGIAHVNFTALWGGRWHTLCKASNNISGSGDYYYCSTNLFADGGYPKNETVTISFDVYDTANHVNYSPNGTFTVYVNSIIADAATTGLNIGGKLLAILGPASDCLLSAVPQGESAAILINGTVRIVIGIAEKISTANTVRLIVKDISTGQYEAAVEDISAHYSNVPGMACDDAQKALQDPSLKWLNWAF